MSESRGGVHSRAVPGVKRARPILLRWSPSRRRLAYWLWAGWACLPTRGGGGQSRRLRRSAPPYGPPYSPDLNPIEKMWSKVRQFLRRVKARTQEALWQAIGAALQTVSDTDAVNWFRSCGYCYE